MVYDGHAKRSQGCINIVMDVEMDDNKKRPGRPRRTWKQCVDSDMKACKLKHVDTLDRVKWRKAVKDSLLLFQGIWNEIFLFLPTVVQYKNGY